jgi:hypothetical protein
MHHGDVTPEIAAGLLALKKRIDAAKIPPSKLDETINVAVWNIREFGKKRRSVAALHYIAEILGQFDLIALVELRDNLEDFGRVCQFLGSSWDLVYSDWISDAGGNRERAGFLYDRRAVTFNGLAAEVDAPRAKKDTEYLAALSFWRAPYMCSFRAGNFDFIAIATHTRWGDSLPGRKPSLACWPTGSTRGRGQVGRGPRPDRDGRLQHALARRQDLQGADGGGGLQVPDSLLELKVGDVAVKGSNLGKDARYDQILHLPTAKKRFTNFGGTLDFYVSDASIKQLFPGQDMTRTQFTYQLSDHFPVWVQIKTDIDGERLSQIVQNAKKD